MQKSFTLLELLIVVVIVGILASISLPQYYRTREHALGREAVANLRLILAAQRVYRMENGTYYGPQADDATINTNLRILLSTTNWHYKIEDVTPATFTAWAERNGAGGVS